MLLLPVPVVSEGDVNVILCNFTGVTEDEVVRNSDPSSVARSEIIVSVGV
jgi:uncharacterized UPF0160 family protein